MKVAIGLFLLLFVVSLVKAETLSVGLEDGYSTIAGAAVDAVERIIVK